MKLHYQDNLGGWHVLESADHEYLLTKNNPDKTFTAKTQAEYDSAHAPQPPTEQEQRDQISNAIQKLIEDKAKSLRYDSIDSVAKYIGYPNAFQAEALRLATYAANCWAKAETIESQVNSGTIPIPTVVEALAMMPDY